MAEQPPVVRGRHLKALLAALAAHPEGGQVLARLPSDLRRQIGQASGLDWLPVERNVAVTEAVYDGQGAPAADRFFRDQSLEAFQGPLFQTLVSTAIKIFGLDAGAFVGWIPTGWNVVFRGVGAWSGAEAGPGPDTLQLQVTGLPAVCAESPVWLRSVGHSFEAVLVVARVPGAVELQPRPRGSRDATYRFRWGARAAAGRPAPRA
jgi:hypothetical protein